MNHESEFDVYRERWAHEWSERSPGLGRSNFGDNLSRNLLAKSRAFADDKRLPDAITAAEAAVHADPEVARNHFFLATLFYRNEMLPEAEKAYRQAIDIDAADSVFHDGLARLLRDRGDMPGAVQAAQAAVACAPDVAGSHFFLGILYAQSEQIAAAEIEYRKAAALDSSDARYARAHAETLQRLGRIEEAIGAIRNAVEAAPDNSDYRVQLAKYYIEYGDFDAAEAVFAEAMANAPQAINIIESYRDLMVRRGRDADAKPLTEKLAILDPGSVGVKNQLANHHLDLGEVDSAKAALTAATELSEASLQVDAAGDLNSVFSSSVLIDDADGPTGFQDLLTVLSARRAATLVSSSADHAAITAAARSGDIWPVGAVPPDRTYDRIAKYGSVSDRWNRLIAALRNPGISYREQFRARPAIAVMIPVYDVQNADWLRAAVRSASTSNFDGGEVSITIVDDASTNDVAAGVAREFGPLVSYVRNRSNLGIVGNHNQCIRLARGELVHVLHQDDRLHPDFYTRIAGPLLADSSIVAGFSRARLVTEDGEYRNDQSMARNTPGLIEDFSTKIALRQRILFPSMIVRRRAYEAAGGFADSLVFAFDLEMWGRLAALGPIWHEPEPLADYRIHTGSVTNSLTARTRLIDGMRATHLNIGHLPTAKRADTLFLSLYRLIRRDWDRLVRRSNMIEADSSDIDLFDFLLGGLLAGDDRDRLFERLFVTNPGRPSETI
ncbi:tetratricopeptide repeat protein [Parasphingopyxis sp. CP4]|uniref:tetratricopeptide repeat protein n=1 Tax=Parasphingopyxis sp. CP4 TaxID=2724527 RepID=UPI0015A21F3B|nr:tetratricopeptide repeat protein [Parasphingopyxis sp. CP4]QLC22462.1 tetratricopeptide repeat protein [Parasphingopyxis sp. CP4]